MKPNDIIKELEEMDSPLAGMSRVMPYMVPEGYFNSLNNDITGRIFQPSAALLIERTNTPFDVPQGYFQMLPEQLLNAAKASDALADMPKAMPFATPAGYFEGLPQQLRQAAKQADEITVERKTKTILLGKVGKTLRWAAAAVLLLGISVGSYKMLTPAVDTVSTETALASVPNNVLNDYVDQNFTDMDPEVRDMQAVANINGLDKVNAEEIEYYLNETGWEETL
ncbi:MAG: hypothetical protein EOP56_14980 [Sphingobacteriales bacterium]|nr:MAG: hypothetical protein EOP56_14980 [Sphingobacteriales bacterium]